MHLRVVGLELRHVLGEEAVEAVAVAVPLGVREGERTLIDRRAAGGGPPSVFFVDFGHEPAQDGRGRLEQVEAG
jgi:hypothetical protein